MTDCRNETTYEKALASVEPQCLESIQPEGKKHHNSTITWNLMRCFIYLIEQLSDSVR